jgi:hypothetical protein
MGRRLWERSEELTRVSYAPLIPSAQPV